MFNFLNQNKVEYTNFFTNYESNNPLIDEYINLLNLIFSPLNMIFWVNYINSYFTHFENFSHFLKEFKIDYDNFNFNFIKENKIFTEIIDLIEKSKLHSLIEIIKLIEIEFCFFEKSNKHFNHYQLEECFFYIDFIKKKS